MTENSDSMTETISELLSCPLFVGKPKASMKARTSNRQNGKPNVFQRLAQLIGG